MNELILTGEYIQPLLNALSNEGKHFIKNKGNSIYIRTDKVIITIVHIYKLTNPEKRKEIIKDIPLDIINKIIGLLSIGVDKYIAFKFLIGYMS